VIAIDNHCDEDNDEKKSIDKVNCAHIRSHAMEVVTKPARPFKDTEFSHNASWLQP
jgi:hypothetical protein